LISTFISSFSSPLFNKSKKIDVSQSKSPNSICCARCSNLILDGLSLNSSLVTFEKRYFLKLAKFIIDTLNTPLNNNLPLNSGFFCDINLLDFEGGVVYNFDKNNVRRDKWIPEDSIVASTMYCYNCKLPLGNFNIYILLFPINFLKNKKKIGIHILAGDFNNVNLIGKCCLSIYSLK
jgi:hypothetical protein